MEITRSAYDDLWFGRVLPPRSQYAICFYKGARPCHTLDSIPIYYHDISISREFVDEPILIMYEAGETTVTGRTTPGTIVNTITLPLAE
jgi:hypothetical protein